MRTPTVDPANESIYNQYTLRVAKRDALQSHLRDKEIGSAVYYPLSLHLQPCFEYLRYKRGAFPESERATQEVISSYYVTGDADFVLVLSMEDMEHYKEFTEKFFHGDPDVKWFRITCRDEVDARHPCRLPSKGCERQGELCPLVGNVDRLGSYASIGDL